MLSAPPAAATSIPPAAVARQLAQPPANMREQRRSVFDTTNVTRIMAHNLPTGVKISRDAKQCMCQIASEMTAFVTMEASAIAKDKVANGVRPNMHYS